MKGVWTSVKNLLIEISLAALFFLLGSFLYYFSPLFLEIFLGKELLNAFAQSFSALKNNAYCFICLILLLGTAFLLFLIELYENFQRLKSFLLNLWILRSMGELFLQNLAKKNHLNIQDAEVKGSHYVAIGKLVDDRIFGLNLIESFISDLLRQNLSESYAYAITSKWGNGKTSFLKIIKDELVANPKTKSEIKLIDFKPWHFISMILSIRTFMNHLMLQRI